MRHRVTPEGSLEEGTCGPAVQLEAPERSSGAGLLPAAAWKFARGAGRAIPAPARRLFHESFKLLSHHTDIPPHKGAALHLSAKPLKEMPLRSYRFTLCALPRNLAPFICRKGADIWAFGTSRLFICHQRRRGRGLASRGINFQGFRRLVGDAATTGE